MTRPLLAALLLACLSVAGADDDPQARELFDAMHAKLSQARTLKLAFRANVGPQGAELKLAGDLFLGEGDRVALLTQGQDPDGKPLRAAVVSDGEAVFRWRQDAQGQASKAPTPKQLGPRFRACLSKLTALGSAFLFGLPQDGVADPFQVGELRLGGAQTIEGRALRMIEYDVSVEAGPLSHVQVWIDTASGLPYQRRILGGEQGSAIVEVFLGFELNGELPAEVFQLPEVGQEPPAAPTPAPPLAPVDPAGADQARALLEALDAKLAAAKTLRVRSTTLMGPAEKRARFATRVELGEQGRLRLVMEGQASNGTQVRLEVVSDGARRSTLQAAGGRAQRDLDQAPPGLGSTARAALGRLSPTVLLRRDALDDATIPVAGFVLGPASEEGGRALRQIEFDSTAPDLPMHVTLWLDTATGLPVKRVIGDSTHAEALVETFDAWEFDVALEPEAFAVPDAAAGGK